MSFNPNPKNTGRPPLDLTGLRFGRWSVLRNGGRTPSLVTLWLCRCDCGVEQLVRTGGLRKGTSRSCGCLRSERMQVYAARQERDGGRFVAR